MIRKAQEKDILGLRDIYNEAILNSVATFDMEIKSEEDRRKWFNEHQPSPYALIVDERDGVVAGFASLSLYRERKAFDSTVELSVYVSPDFQGMGIGEALCREVLSIAEKNKDVHCVISLITSINERSIALHKKLGFSYCGTMPQVGRKFDQWLGLEIYQILYD